MDKYEEISHWALGVIESAEPDRADLKHAMTKADNAMFTSIAGVQGNPAKRDGMTLVNSTPFSNTSATEGPAIVAGTGYIFDSGGSRTYYQVVVMADGDVHLLLDDGSSTNITPDTSFNALLNATTTGASFAFMNGRMFVLDREGGMESFLGDENTLWGVPQVTGLGLAVGAAGGMTGDYEIVVTGFDTQISEESERSSIVSITGVTADKIDITVDSVAVGLTNRFFRVYIRKATLGSGFFRVLTGTGFDATAQGYPLYSAGATATTTIDLSDADITALVLTPPSIGSRGLPPTTAKYAWVYQRRLFLADDEAVYWSELDRPDAFNALSVEPISSPGGGKIVGGAVHAKRLYIFTETARHYIEGGTDPKAWVIDIDDPLGGAVSQDSITVINNHMYWWNRRLGPEMMDPSGQVRHIGRETNRSIILEPLLNSAFYYKFTTVARGGRVLFGIVEVNESSISRYLSWNTDLGAWESTKWDPMYALATFVAIATNTDEQIYLGNTNGQLFRMLDGGNDGVRDGTTSGSFDSTTTGTISTITDLTAAFDTTGAGLIGRRVQLIDEDGHVVPSARITITENTATELTLSSTFTVEGTADEPVTYMYVIGGPDFVFDTFTNHMGLPFKDKRFDKLYSEFRANEGVANIATTLEFTWSEAPSQRKSAADFTGASLWDVAEWDLGEWDGDGLFSTISDILQVGTNFKVRLRNPYPNQGFTVLKLAVLARVLSDRIIR